VVLMQGTASGENVISDTSNTGYLTGKFSFSGATVTSSGFDGKLTLSAPLTFYPLDPLGYQITAWGGYLDVVTSRIDTGAIQSGTITLPTSSVCLQNPGAAVSVHFNQLNVHSDLDLSGTVYFGSDAPISWGELTHLNEEVIAWKLAVPSGYFYLSANPLISFTPDEGGHFLDFAAMGTGKSITAKLDSIGMNGITMEGADMTTLTIFSPDGKKGSASPITMQKLKGWLRIGSRGVDGELEIEAYDIALDFGNTGRSGYVGGKAFDAKLSLAKYEKPIMIQYVGSAVYDSEIDGTVDIPPPCHISALAFTDMEFTSTANMVGGGIALDDTVTLEYWDLAFLKTNPGVKEAGFISARTGRLIFTGAGIWEKIHFKKPFGLTWCEMFADGNIGELYLDHDTRGQRFDNLRFCQHNLVLSKASAGDKGPKEGAYLAVCGTVHFNFFGGNFININDAYSDSAKARQKRYVTVPDKGDASSKMTDLHLHGKWNYCSRDKANLTIFDFPDKTMDYNVKLQEGFIGTGITVLSFLYPGVTEQGKASDLPAEIIVRRDATDICFSSTSTQSVDLGLFAVLGSIDEFWGCARIEGPQLQRINFGGYFEASAASGIVMSQAGYLVSTNSTVTPNTCVTYASGEMVCSFAGNSVLVSGSMRLSVDHSKEEGSGEFNGSFDFTATGLDFEGAGQVTWHTDPYFQHLQGRVSLELCSWVGAGALEGGLFIGDNTPKDKAWVLMTDSEHFGISQAILPDTLTGFYGYGQVSFGVQYYVFSGGIDLYAGLGAFLKRPGGLNNDYENTAYAKVNQYLPYILGSAGVNVHGEILGGLVSASAWGDLDLLVDYNLFGAAISGESPLYFEGQFGLRGCVLWVLCASVNVTAGLSPSDGFYLY
ncbi:hypothetical protein JXO59_09720, partial [candidate division KSB1 bacterium]|nr:hypothetical protein [candidate division KSB1 bacterium]